MNPNVSPYIKMEHQNCTVSMVSNFAYINTCSINHCMIVLILNMFLFLIGCSH